MAIPQWLKHYALACTDLRQLQLPFESPVYQLSDDIVLDLNKIYCKQIYKLFVEKIDVEPTAIKSWRKHSPEIADQWTTSIQNSYKITRDNKLRQFYFKLLHRILVTNKELKYFGITNATKCAMCDEFDSIEHAFLECQSLKKLCVESLQWFNDIHQTNINLTPLQIFLNLITPLSTLSDKQSKELRLLLLYAKQYSYACKTMQKKIDTMEFISKFHLQLKVDL